MADAHTSPSGASASKGGAATTVYEIKDAAGKVVAEHVRFDYPDGTKEVKWRLPGGTFQEGLDGRKLETLPLYGVHELDPEAMLSIVVEGEKARDALAEALKDAPVNVFGTVTGASLTPSIESLEALRGQEAVLWPDTDQQGIKHMNRIAERLQGIAALVRMYTWHDAPEVWVEGKDGKRKLKAQDAADHPAVKNG